MGLKKNLLYSSILTTSGYLFPLLTYPYVSRILGVDNIGICGFVDSIVNFFVLFSMMGVGSVGIREIAKYRNCSKQLARTFSGLFVLTVISTVIVLVVFLVVLNTVPVLYEYRMLLYVGAIKIILTPFLIEWFFSGIEDFRYITIRGLIIKCLYVISVFLFVQCVDDYMIYYGLTVGMVVVGGIFNWNYRRKFISLTFHNLRLRKYLKSFMIMGCYLLLTSLYTSFNITYLGFVCGDREVGYYTTATKLYSIILAMFTAFTGVMLPRISSLVANNCMEEVKALIGKSFRILFMFCCPLVIFSILFAAQIIEVISGAGYSGAIIPMRIIMPLMLIIGMEQILILQLLIPLKKDNYIITCSAIGACVGTVANLLLVHTYQSIGSAIVWVLSEISIFTVAGYFVYRLTKIRVPYRELLFQVIYSIPYAGICCGVHLLSYTSIFTLLLAGCCCCLYFILLHIIIRKEPLLLQLLFRNKPYRQ